jgi:hypothetical protein
MKGAKEQSEFVSLAGVVGGIFLVIVIMVLIFAKESLVFLLTNAVWAFVVLGIALGGFMSKTKKRR